MAEWRHDSPHLPIRHSLFAIPIHHRIHQRGQDDPCRAPQRDRHVGCQCCGLGIDLDGPRAELCGQQRQRRGGVDQAARANHEHQIGRFGCRDRAVEVIASATSKVDQKEYPMGIIHLPGKGRVFNCTLGHDLKAMESRGVCEMYRRGVAWSVGLDP